MAVSGPLTTILAVRGLQQDNRSSGYNHLILVMTELNTTTSEKTSNIYHLPPVCVFAVRNRTAIEAKPERCNLPDHRETLHQQLATHVQQ